MGPPPIKPLTLTWQHIKNVWIFLISTQLSPNALQTPYPVKNADKATKTLAAECLLCILSILDACFRSVPHLDDSLAATIVPDLAKAIQMHSHTQVRGMKQIQ